MKNSLITSCKECRMSSVLTVECKSCKKLQVVTELQSQSPEPMETGNTDRAGMPVFTAQDEMAERASLTTPEVEGIFSDLHGITVGFAKLQMNPEVKERPPRPIVLSHLEDELCKLPAERKEAYCQAMLKCPGLVSNERKMAFLEREDGDTTRAAVRLALHWELRLEIFGPERCFLPKTLDGAMKGETENMVRWPIHQILPVKDTAGRAIWYGDPSFRDYENYIPEQELMAFWYMLEVAGEAPGVLKQGIVLLGNWKDTEMKNFRQNSKRFAAPTERMVLILEQALPMHVRAGHYCNPNNVVYYLLPIYMKFFGRKYRQRLQLHRGSEEEILQELEKFCLPRDRVPTDLGGDVVLDMAKFLAQRMVLESSKPDPRIVLNQQPVPVPKGPAAKRVRNNDTAAETNESEVKNDRGKRDPRMTRAVDIRLDNPKMPLKDVLTEAGFKFDFEDEKGELLDVDNITLQQRRNQLCRRVRNDAAAETNESEVKNDRGKRDPRMTRAVDIRLDNPKMPLKDVLTEAGFKFDFEDEKGELLDDDNITLQQRRNQLCRRVRHEKLKREARGAGQVEAQQEDT